MLIRKLFLVLACTLGVMALLPDDAQAHGDVWPVYRFLSVDVGWEGMLLDDGGYEGNNSGFMLTVSGGISLVFFGIGLEQDLGYIHLSPVSSLKNSGIDGERLFKGATILTFPLMIADPDKGGFGLQLRPGIGALYMQAPSEQYAGDYYYSDYDFGFGYYDRETPTKSRKSVQSWFAFRLALGGIAYLNSDVGLGIDFVYTLAAADGNVFDGEDVVNFVSVKAKVVFDFSY